MRRKAPRVGYGARVNNTQMQVILFDLQAELTQNAALPFRRVAQW